MEPRTDGRWWLAGGDCLSGVPSEEQLADNLLQSDPPPEVEPKPATVVLGRFQPFHLGHAHLICKAVKVAANHGHVLRIAIGSTNRPESIDDPWTFKERRAMIDAWSTAEGVDLEVVGVPDLGDSKRWVSHAESYHGRSGILVSSEPEISDLYEASGWTVERVELTARGNLQGWRIRATMRMLSTISDDAAIMEVLGPTIPSAVIENLIATEAIRRLAFLGGGGEPVG